MRKRMTQSLLILATSLCLMFSTVQLDEEKDNRVANSISETIKSAEVVELNNFEVLANDIVKTKSTYIEEIIEPELVPEEPKMSEEDINLIALVTMAEAEGESEYGKRLVIDTILNRVDHEWSYWPDTVKGVIYQKGQFTSMWNGRVDRCYVRDDIVQLVKEELENRANTDVVYFMMGDYSKYGSPLFKEGCHYFSSY